MSRTATLEMIDGGGGGSSSGDHHQSRRIHHGCWFMVACRDTGRQIPAKRTSLNINLRLDIEHGSSTPGSNPAVPPTASPCLLALARAYSPHPLIKTVTAAAAAAAKAGAEATPSLPPSLLFRSQSRNALPLTFWEMPSAPLRSERCMRAESISKQRFPTIRRR